MGYKIQIRGVGELLDDRHVHQAIHDAMGNHEIIPDHVARSIAAFWHSPGNVGRVLSQLSHGIEFDTDELVADIDKTMPEAEGSWQQKEELLSLRSWAEHWTGDYRS